MLLSGAKLAMFAKQGTDFPKESLAPGGEHCLKTPPDGTMPDGHHRVDISRSRGEDVDSLPREVLLAAVGEGRSGGGL